jgi:phosphatidylinositol-3-phosphatase
MMLALKAGSLPRRVLISAVILLLALARLTAGTIPPIQTVFVIVLENESWAEVEGNTNAPYLNSTLLSIGSHCDGYYNVPNLHPSLPNYLWLEAGTNFGILDDNDPDLDHQNTTNHFVTLLKNAGISWKTYHEDIPGTNVPLSDWYGYAVRHNPFVYFDDVTGTNNPAYAYGIAHIRPYSELAADLTNNTIARYNFLKPNICNDGHDSCSPFYDPIRQIDAWLAAEVPKILNSQAYSNNGALFITWDESQLPDPRIGMIVLSPLARGGGYTNNIYYTHSSTLRTFQEIFGVGPFLGDAANATDLSDLFFQFGIHRLVKMPSGAIHITAVGITPGRTNIVEASTDLKTWSPISTNISTTTSFATVDSDAASLKQRFYRLLQLP